MTLLLKVNMWKTSEQTNNDHQGWGVAGAGKKKVRGDSHVQYAHGGSASYFQCLDTYKQLWYKGNN